jgi:hypothetical protein
LTPKRCRADAAGGHTNCGMLHLVCKLTLHA